MCTPSRLVGKAWSMLKAATFRCRLQCQRRPCEHVGLAELVGNVIFGGGDGAETFGHGGRNTRDVGDGAGSCRNIGVLAMMPHLAAGAGMAWMLSVPAPCPAATCELVYHAGAGMVGAAAVAAAPIAVFGAAAVVAPVGASISDVVWAPPRRRRSPLDTSAVAYPSATAKPSASACGGVSPTSVTGAQRSPPPDICRAVASPDPRRATFNVSANMAAEGKRSYRDGFEHMTGAVLTSTRPKRPSRAAQRTSKLCLQSITRSLPRHRCTSLSHPL